MMIIHDYNEYINRILNGDTQSIFSGELSVIRTIESLGSIIPEGRFYVWDNIGKQENPVVNLVEVNYDGRYICISNVQHFEINLDDVAQNLGIEDLGTALRWWNLCFFRDKNGKVLYDTSYNELFVANESEFHLSSIISAFDEALQQIIIDCDNPMLVFEKSNPLVYLLQEKCKDIRCITRSSLPDENNEDIRTITNNIRNVYTTPNSYGNPIAFSFYPNKKKRTTSTVENRFIVSLPCGRLNLDDYAIGNLRFKEVLPDGKVLKDYYCNTSDFMYLEYSYYVDLFGNTILKTTNSMGQNHLVSLNINKIENRL